MPRNDDDDDDDHDDHDDHDDDHDDVSKKTTEHFQEMIAEEDPDGDGIVTKEEFTKMLERKK